MEMKSLLRDDIKQETSKVLVWRNSLELRNRRQQVTLRDKCASIENYRAQINEGQAKIEEMIKEIKKLSWENGEMKEYQRGHSEKFKVLEMELRHLTTASQTQRECSKNLLERKSQLDSEISSLSQEFSNLTHSYEKGKEKSEHDLNQAKEENDEMKKEMNFAMEKFLCEIETQKTNYKSLISEKEKEKESLSALLIIERKDLESALASEKALKEELKIRECDYLRDKDTAESNIGSLKNNIRALEEELKASQEKMIVEERKMKELNEKHENIQNAYQFKMEESERKEKESLLIIEDKIKEAETLSKELNEERMHSQQLKSDINCLKTKVESESEQIEYIQGELGEAKSEITTLKNVELEKCNQVKKNFTLETRLRAFEKELKEMTESRTKFEREKEGVILNLKTKIAEVESKKKEWEAVAEERIMEVNKIKSYVTEIEERERNLRSQKSRTETDREDTLLEKEKEIKELEKELKKEGARIEGLEVLVKCSKSKEEELKEIREKLECKERELEEIRDLKEKAEGEVDFEKTEVKKWLEETKRLKEAMWKLKDDYEERLKELREAQKAKRVIEEETRGLRSREDEMEVELKSKIEEVKALKISEGKLLSKIVESQETLEMSKDKAESRLQSVMSAKDGEIESYKESVTILQNKNQELERMLGEMRKKEGEDRNDRGDGEGSEEPPNFFRRSVSRRQILLNEASSPPPMLHEDPLFQSPKKKTKMEENDCRDNNKRRLKTYGRRGKVFKSFMDS